MTPETPIMEQITPRLRKVGDFYELDGEEFRRVVGRPSSKLDGLDVAWGLRQFAVEAGVDMAEDDNLPDEPIRRTVGKTGPG